MTGDGFTGRREGVEIKDVIGVDTAKDDKFACGFHNQYSRKSRHRNPVAHALLFFNYVVPRTVADPNRTLLLNDQFQLNRIAGLHFFALQHFIGCLNAFHADLLR